jgi:hypothetical protein|tara:strand:- start:4281 stop:4442 length:162 start_codon:yes stop_codon:yes gene_type:complete
MSKTVDITVVCKNCERENEITMTIENTDALVKVSNGVVNSNEWTQLNLFEEDK